MTINRDRPAVTPGPHRLTRRATVLGAAASVAGAVSIRAQGATPDGTPDASPAAATPVATSTPTPTPPPTPTPVPVYPLKIIEDQRPAWSGEPVPGGDLRLFVKPGSLSDFTPTTFQQDFGVMMSYLDPLIWVDEVTLEPKPWLARSWTWSEDKLSLEIVLRDDVTWHDGSPLTADDVRFSLLCHRDDFDSAVSFMLAVVADVEVVDETHLVVRFDEPDGTFPFNAANLPVFQRAQWEEHWLKRPVGERTLTKMPLGDRHPIGTGPWVIEERSESEVRFRRNDGHFTAVPLADTLTMVAEGDFDRQFDAWKQDDADLIWPFPGERVEENLRTKGSLVVADATVSYFAAFNFGNPTRLDPGWMASAGLREALIRVVNRKAYADSIFGGMIDVDRAGFMTQPWAIDPSVVNPKRDVDAARKLLSDNGWGDWDGDGILDSPRGDRGVFVCIVREDAGANLLAILDTLDADFKELGFGLEVQRLSPADFTARWTSGFDYDLIAIQLTQYAAFSEFDLVGAAWSIRRNPAGWNPGGYWNPEVDQALVNYLQAVDIDEMKRELSIVQRQTNDDPFAIWLGFPKQPVLIRPDVAGFQPNKMWQSWNTWSLWHGEDALIATPTPLPPTPTPVPSTPQATPGGASPVAIPDDPSGATPAS